MLSTAQSNKYQPSIYRLLTVPLNDPSLLHRYEGSNVGMVQNYYLYYTAWLFGLLKYAGNIKASYRFSLSTVNRMEPDRVHMQERVERCIRRMREK